VATEASADLLGADLMAALSSARGSHVSFRGLGGPRMAGAGLVSTGHLHDLPNIGPLAVVANLPTILRQLRETVEAIVANPPSVLVLIDAPDFTHRVAARVRKRLPDLPIVKYVSPTVWAWRPGRARAMRPFIDLVLALLPFEPEVHRQLGGPECVYVGHSLLQRLDQLRPSPPEVQRRAGAPPLVLVLPGSRRTEIERLSATFGETLGLVSDRYGPLDIVLPTLPHLVSDLSARTAAWPTPPRIVTGEAEKYSAFRSARAALAASGTVTLELALAGVPTVAAYKVPAIEAQIFRMMVKPHPVIKVYSVILPNIALHEVVIPEFLQRDCTAAHLAAALTDILGDSPARRRQVDAFTRLDAVFDATGAPPSVRAANAILDLVSRRASVRR
jgi:lipid-A-disaccharide synthase